MLPPAGYRVPLRVLGAATLRRLTHPVPVAAIERRLAERLDVRAVFAVSSGKAALTVILQAMARISTRRKVVIPAYTCYSVPSAIVKAGLVVEPCDLAPDSFDYDYAQLQSRLDEDVLCVVSVHLLGVPASTDRLRRLCGPLGIFVVEDAAQAMGGTLGGRPLGTCGDVGFFSFGRGKNFTCGSGGVVLTDRPDLAAALGEVVAAVPPASLVDEASTVGALLAVSSLLSPTLYWLPAGLPFLRLGETIFHEDFPVTRLSLLQAMLLDGWQSQLTALETVRRHQAEHYAAAIAGGDRFGRGIAYLRFPIVLPDETAKRRLLGELDGAALGITGMYPTTVGAIPELQGKLSETRFPRAERLASTLVTLPTHALVTGRDRARICAAVNSAVGGRQLVDSGTTAPSSVHAAAER
jgi:dTDP-4-amino-4,6-dideoxygalactose transaminase